MLVRCNKRHLCEELDRDYCFHADWHEYSSNCNNRCSILKDINPDDMHTDCIEQEQEFINEKGNNIMLVRCNKRHLCGEGRDYCTHYDWHRYNGNCNDLCGMLKFENPDDKHTDCTEINQPNFISKEDMVIC